MGLSVQMQLPGNLTLPERLQMFALMESYFLGVHWKEFQRDLEEKDQVMVLRDSDGTIVGFSTLMRLLVDVPIGRAWLVFSGDTVVKQGARCYCGFGYGMGAYYNATRQLANGHPAYYILISKGWRTYRIMPFLFRNFYPSPDQVTTKSIRDVCDAFGWKKYPARYDQHRGIIVGLEDAQRINPQGPDVVSPHRLADPYVEFFTRANPRHEQGDELVCVASLDPANYSSAYARLLKRQPQEGPCEAAPSLPIS